MSKKQMTLVYYYVPQDKDDPEQPNVFGIPQSKLNLRVNHIQEHFPLKGTYIFRFKVAFEGGVAWLDVNDHEGRLPTFRDRIIVKATRVSWNDQNINGYLKEKSSQAQSAPAKNESAHLISQPHKNNIDLFDSHQMQQAPTKVETKGLMDINFLGETQPKQEFNLMGSADLNMFHSQKVQHHKDSLL